MKCLFPPVERLSISVFVNETVQLLSTDFGLTCFALSLFCELIRYLWVRGGVGLKFFNDISKLRTKSASYCCFYQSQNFHFYARLHHGEAYTDQESKFCFFRLIVKRSERILKELLAEMILLLVG